VFEFTFALADETTFKNVVTSFTIGGEASLKGISLCLFSFKYLDASLESPQFRTLSNGKRQLILMNREDTKKILEVTFTIKWLMISLFLINWALISASEYLFTKNLYFNSPTPVLIFFETQMITTAILFLIVSFILGYAVRRIWASLCLIPQLQKS